MHSAGVPEPCTCLWQMQLSSLPWLRPRPVIGRGTRNQGWLRPGGFCLVLEGSYWAGLGLDSGLEPLGWTTELLGAAGSGHLVMLARRKGKAGSKQV